jgi:hypothetical protein
VTDPEIYSEIDTVPNDERGEAFFLLVSLQRRRARLMGSLKLPETARRKRQMMACQMAYQMAYLRASAMVHQM